MDYEYEPLVQSDDFRKVSGLSEEKEYERYGCYGLKSVWQFNHEPDLRLVKQNTEQGILWIETGKVCQSLLYATNILTQRMIFPCCAGEVTVEASTLKIGDYAGLCALQGCYGMVAVDNGASNCCGICLFSPNTGYPASHLTGTNTGILPTAPWS